MVPEVLEELEEDFVWLVRLAPEVADVRLELELLDEPRRVVVDEPSVLTVLVVVRVEPLVFTRDVVVVLAGLTLRDVVVLPLVWLVRLEELLEVLDEPEVLVRLELLEVLDELEEPVRLELPDVPEVLLDELEEELVWLVRLEEVLPVVVVVLVFGATRCCSSRALLIAAVRLPPEVLSLATRFENVCSGWRVS